MNTTTKEQLKKALDTANGKRRARTATMHDVESIVRRGATLPSGQGFRATFGTVANGYDWRAPATQITVVRVGEELRMRIACGNAAKVAGGGSDYVESTKNRDVTALLASAEGAIVVRLDAERQAAQMEAEREGE